MFQPVNYQKHALSVVKWKARPTQDWVLEPSEEKHWSSPNICLVCSVRAWVTVSHLCGFTKRSRCFPIYSLRFGFTFGIYGFGWPQLWFQDLKNCLERLNLENYDQCHEIKSSLRKKHRLILIPSPKAGNKVSPHWLNALTTIIKVIIILTTLLLIIIITTLTLLLLLITPTLLLITTLPLVEYVIALTVGTVVEVFGTQSLINHSRLI